MVAVPLIVSTVLSPAIVERLDAKHGESNLTLILLAVGAFCPSTIVTLNWVLSPSNSVEDALLAIAPDTKLEPDPLPIFVVVPPLPEPLLMVLSSAEPSPPPPQAESIKLISEALRNRNVVFVCMVSS